MTLSDLRAKAEAATKTAHGWWLGEPYSFSFGLVGDPESRITGREPDDDPADFMCDVWAGDKDNDDDNSPLICECVSAEDAAYIAAANPEATIKILDMLDAEIARRKSAEIALKLYALGQLGAAAAHFNKFKGE